MGYKYRRRYTSNRSYSINSMVPSSTVGDIRKYQRIVDTTTHIKNEFLNCDSTTFKQISDLYKQRYGLSAYDYMIETLPKWKLGFVDLSGQTMDKILGCVPKFLTDEKRFNILKPEIIHFIETIHAKHQNNSIKLLQLNTTFENYANELNNFHQLNLVWFICYGIFTNAEMEKFLSVCKYALNQKLNLSYRQVQSDLALIKLKFSNFKTGTYFANYKIDFLNTSIDISNINEITLNTVQLNQHEVILDGNFKQFAEQYILDELMKMTFAKHEGEIKYFIKSKDIDFFIFKYNEILEKDIDATLKSDFKGEGGQLNLVLEVKSLKKIKTKIIYFYAKLFFYTILLISIVSINFVAGILPYRISIPVFWILIIVVFLWIKISSEFEILKNSKIDLKKYGK